MQLEDCTRQTPSKPICRGIPEFFKGKQISPAFEDHIFWPSSKEKTKNSSKQIFPACASDRSWRELFRLKNITKSKPKTLRQAKKKQVQTTKPAKEKKKPNTATTSKLEKQKQTFLNQHEGPTDAVVVSENEEISNSSANVLHNDT